MIKKHTLSCNCYTHLEKWTYNRTPTIGGPG